VSNAKGISSSDILEFYINVPPTSGNFKISPVSGSQKDTSFKFEINNWVDSAQDLALGPLKAKITYY